MGTPPTMDDQGAAEPSNRRSIFGPHPPPDAINSPAATAAMRVPDYPHTHQILGNLAGFHGFLISRIQ